MAKDTLTNGDATASSSSAAKCEKKLKGGDTIEKDCVENGHIENGVTNGTEHCHNNGFHTNGVENGLSEVDGQIKCEGVSITDSSDLTEAFNDHFVTVGPKLADEISTSVNNRSLLYYLSSHIHDHEPFQLE
ncbi:Hypothetical predicted protein [Paramuricea clavata]|uniref:Uncharacterized protein n=1 Tax=Paramuricea clavata TaxID=317549 RepID=A0A6S7IIM2_PARCT|nr:Hypothetical predicted protein [Paramuricea clavata]